MEETQSMYASTHPGPQKKKCLSVCVCVFVPLLASICSECYKVCVASPCTDEICAAPRNLICVKVSSSLGSLKVLLIMQRVLDEELTIGAGQSTQLMELQLKVNCSQLKVH